MKRLVLHVERLVLRGVPYPDRHAIANALQAELSRLLARPEADSSRIAAVDSAPPARPVAAPIARDATPAQLGRAVAGAVGSRIGRRAR